MKFKIIFCCFLLFYIFSISLAGEETKPENHTTVIPPEKAYKVGAGDVIKLTVWKDEALSRQVTVLPDGTVSFPLIGQIVAGGKSVAELEQEIAGRIKKYIDPLFDISVMQVNSMLIYVLGKVNQPGQIPIQTDINVLQALAMAGGLVDFADEDSIIIIRKENNQTRSFPFEYDKLIKGEKLEQNIQLQRGDVVIIP